MTNQPIAIRKTHPTRAKAHRPCEEFGRVIGTCCGRFGPSWGAVKMAPLSQTAPEDRCKICWPVAT